MNIYAWRDVLMLGKSVLTARMLPTFDVMTAMAVNYFVEVAL